MLTNILIAAFFFIEIYKMFYPDEYNIILNVAKKDLISFKNNLEPKIFYIAYNIIYYYSCFEIYLNKTRIYIKPYIINILKCVKYFLKKYNIIDCNKECNKECNELVLEFFYQGNLLTSLNFDKNNRDINIDKAPLKYDFIICSDSTMTNKICVSNIHHYFEYDFDFEKTNFTFMSLQLLYKENNYTIELKNDKHNFYIVNNVLDNNFFTYYLKYILNIDNLEKDISYKLELVDQDVNVLLLTDKDNIIVNKQDYTIVNLNEDVK